MATATALKRDPDTGKYGELSPEFKIILADGSNLDDFWVTWTFDHGPKGAKKTVWRRTFPFSAIAPSLQTGLAAKCKRSISDSLANIKEARDGVSVIDLKRERADLIFRQLRQGIWKSQDGPSKGGYTGGNSTVEFWVAMQAFVDETKTWIDEQRLMWMEDNSDEKWNIIAYGLEKRTNKTPTPRQVTKAKLYFEKLANEKAESYKRLQNAADSLDSILDEF